MTLLNNAKIATKILSLLLLLGIVTVGVAFMGSHNLYKVDEQYSLLVDKKLPASVAIARANRRSVAMSFAAAQSIVYDAQTQIAQDAPAKEDNAFKEALKLLGEVKTALPDNAAEIAGFETRLTAMHELTSEAARLGAANRNDEARAVLGRSDKIGTPLGQDMTTFNDVHMAEGAKLSSSLSDMVASTATSLLVISLLGIAIAIGVALYISRIGITGPLAKLHDAMSKLAGGNNHLDIPGSDRGDEVGTMAKTVIVFRDAAVRLERQEAEKEVADATQKMVVETVGDNLGNLAKGDLTVSITADFPGSYASLKTNFNDATASLRSLIGSVTETAGSILTGSNEIAQASEDLARRTEGNAASLEETSAAIQQIDSRLKATAVAAERSVAGSEQTMSAVGEGRTRTDEAVSAMGRVSESAKGIDNVIEGLDKIAFQTRVLAMNAAVEAGRAGDAGRGFAVVADLVSALAMRAEEEAKRARDQLTVTQSEIASAVDAVQKVEGALTEISTAGQEATTLAHQIAADNLAQASAISQVSTAINAMDQATQQNAAMVEETSAAARNLTTEVTNLTSQASQFDVGGNKSRAISAPAPVKAAVPARRKAAPAYVSPVKALPAMAGAAADDNWNGF